MAERNGITRQQRPLTGGVPVKQTIFGINVAEERLSSAEAAQIRKVTLHLAAVPFWTNVSSAANKTSTGEELANKLKIEKDGE